ncbi:hypothetical protein PIB30_043858 [Stylosanthes scabra]|uniref:RRM domain-containing protein n=1 Tax=Stylosanthes scabra TaxID=79078 RepID=A0ABU6ZEF9_9FABA|nr:hypothetical protein [Stylosanthes scabra]
MTKERSSVVAGGRLEPRRGDLEEKRSVCSLGVWLLVARVRKQRSGSKGPFAFVRYDNRVSAAGAINRLNDKMWRGSKLTISVSNYRRKLVETPESRMGYAKPTDHQRPSGFHGRSERKVKKVWVEVGRRTNNTPKPQTSRVEMKKLARKEVTACISDSQQEILGRSLLGLSSEAMELKTVMERVQKEWQGLGDVVCRDVGLFRYLLTFNTTKIRDEAMTSPALLAIFD